jgi:nitrite reductase/ring-hydroxylating ferredoxin subunit/uncharacterized membrane protein
MHRAITSLIDAQESWAKPFGERVQHWLAGLFDAHRPVKDLLNGTWLGHPVHPSLTDVPVGAMTVAAVLDVAGQDRAADVAIATGVAAMTASAVTGVADAVDAYGKPQVYATVHATLMAGSLVAYTGSLALRIGPRALRPLAVAASMAGYAALTAGAYVGGELVYKQGNQVDRHAFDTASSKWKPLDVTEVPAGKLVKAKAGTDAIVLYRDADGAPIHAFHAVCPHAGGPLDKGAVVDGCVECPWHGSRFRIDDGHLMRGPSVYDVPAFEVREAAAGGLEARRAQPA